VTGCFQLKNGGSTYGRALVHLQDQCRSGRRSEIVPHSIPTSLCGGGLAAREIQLESRALSHLAVRADVSAGLPYEPVDHAQPKAGSLALRLCREERLINTGKHVSRHPAAVIAYLDDCRFARQELGRSVGAIAVKSELCVP